MITQNAGNTDENETNRTSHSNYNNCNIHVIILKKLKLFNYRI